MTHDGLANDKRFLPTERDFDPYGGGLDEQHAWRNFGGLTLEEANKKFRECPENYQEDFMFMGEKAFAFYFPVIESYLREASAYVEGDNREAWILAHCIRQQFTGVSRPEVIDLAPRVVDLAEFVQTNIRFFSSRPDEQREIGFAWQRLKEHVLNVVDQQRSHPIAACLRKLFDSGG